VLLDSFAAGWTATVDGVPARIERADLLARAVAIPPGEHEVVFAYRTPGLRLGVSVSAIAWLAGLAVLVALRRRPGRSRSSVPPGQAKP
jgi:uncharacterized membrane protein YfhO